MWPSLAHKWTGLAQLLFNVALVWLIWPSLANWISSTKKKNKKKTGLKNMLTFVTRVLSRFYDGDRILTGFGVDVPDQAHFSHRVQWEWQPYSWWSFIKWHTPAILNNTTLALRFPPPVCDLQMLIRIHEKSCNCSRCDCFFVFFVSE